MNFIDVASYYSPAALLYKTYGRNERTILSDMTGKTQRDNYQASEQAQIDYEEYLKGGYQRWLDDWHRNLPGREIRYPELSYAGAINRANTSIARAGFSYDTADANYTGGLPYKGAGLYNVFSKLARTL